MLLERHASYACFNTASRISSVSVSQPASHQHPSQAPPPSLKPTTKRGKPHINERLQILIQIRQIILPLLVIRNQALLLLEQFLPLLLQRLPLSQLVVYAREHEGFLVGGGVGGFFGEEFGYGD